MVRDVTQEGVQFAITDDGRTALATSKHLTEAQRKLDAGQGSKPWQGMK